MPPNDPRYLQITDREISIEWYILQEYEAKQRELIRENTPHCTECEYMGDPHRNTENCPRCGAEMKMPQRSDQTTYLDDDVEGSLRELGILLSPKDKEMLKNLSKGK